MRELNQILLVEDDINDVELTLAALSEHNLANKVVVVRDGAEALDYLFRKGTFADRGIETPAVVMLDLKMPKVNGIQVLEQMKADKVLMNIPVVVLTSSRESKDLDRCIELGVSAYMVKPVTFIDFVEATRNVGRYWALVHKPVNNPTLLEHA